MKCPYCGNEMELGNVCARGGGGLYWLPEGKAIKFTVSNKKIEDHGGIVLVNCNEVGMLEHSAYICHTCRKLLMDFDNNYIK